MLEDKKIIKLFCNYHCFAISNSGVIYGWGKNELGELGLNDKKNRNSPQELEYFKGKHVINIVSGYYHSFFICENGEIYSCGWNYQGQLGLGNKKQCYLTPQEVFHFKGKDIIEFFWCLSFTFFIKFYFILFNFFIRKW